MPIRSDGRYADLPAGPRVSMLNLLRERLHLHGTKKGCNQGACTVLVDGEWTLLCLTPVMQHEGPDVTVIEGLTEAGGLPQLQQAFIEHDGFQCGYRAHRQIRPEVDMEAGSAGGAPSVVTADLEAELVELTRDERRDRMSSNLCCCGAHNGMVAAMAETLDTRRREMAA